MIEDDTPRWLKILDALSQLGNMLWPFWSSKTTTPNESISGRCYREGRAFQRVIDAVFRLFRDRDHCQSAHYKDIDRAYQMILLDDRQADTDIGTPHVEISPHAAQYVVETTPKGE